jgi:hypothetical protein
MKPSAFYLIRVCLGLRDTLAGQSPTTFFFPSLNLTNTKSAVRGSPAQKTIEKGTVRARWSRTDGSFRTKKKRLRLSGQSRDG